jgi:hypothetical protein
VKTLAAEELAGVFGGFAEECRGSSPLYERLSREVAGDAHLLKALAPAVGSRFNANVFFASVRYLALKEGGDVPAAPAAFRRFCDERLEAIRALLATRVTQTNEVMRCSYLLLGFHTIWARFGRPLALLEVGASAGLNLLFDRYRYDYGRHGALGPVESPVVLAPSVISGAPPVPADFPPVSWRLGVDIQPLDPRDDDHRLWLKACVWPEHRERERRLEKALDLAARSPARILAGNILDVLDAAAAGAPPDAALVVFHSNTIGYLSSEERTRLAGKLVEIGRQRNAFRLSGEPPSPAEGFEAALRLKHLSADEPEILLARLVQHGRGFSWTAPQC